MNRQLQAPLTLPKHNKLLEEINQTIVDIKFHDDEHPMMIDKDLLIEMRAKHKKHSLVERPKKILNYEQHKKIFLRQRSAAG